MTTDGDVQASGGGTNGLNSLLRRELAAVAAWQRALRSAGGRITVEVWEVLHFAAGHQRTVAALQVAVREMGGVPTREAATSGGFALLTDRATLRELLTAEESGLKMFEAANEALEGDALDLVTLELIPRQQRHIAQLAAILSRLPE